MIPLSGQGQGPLSGVALTESARRGDGWTALGHRSWAARSTCPGADLICRRYASRVIWTWLAVTFGGAGTGTALLRLRRLTAREAAPGTWCDGRTQAMSYKMGLCGYVSQAGADPVELYAEV